MDRLSHREIPETQNPACEVLHLNMNLIKGTEYETLAYIWNDMTKLGEFRDMSSNTIVNDRQMQESFNQIYEHFDDDQVLESENETRARLEQRLT